MLVENGRLLAGKRKKRKAETNLPAKRDYSPRLKTTFAMEKENRRKNRSLTSNAFQKLLDWLDEGNNSDGQKYLEMRERLCAFFVRKSCLDADGLADETFNRVAAKLEEIGKIESETPAKYCYITARFVFLEYLREKERTNVTFDDVSAEKLPTSSNSFAEDKNLKEKMLECLEKCTEKLEVVNREIIVGYYFGEERIKINNRRKLATELEMSVNALSIRACRIRSKLEVCVKNCVGDA